MDANTDLNHIALLQNRANTSGDTILLKLPDLRESGPPQEWNNVITVAEFAAEVDRVANFFVRELSTKGVPLRSVVTLLYYGWAYRDLLYVIGLSRASYIPELLYAGGMSNPAMVCELMDQAGSKALLYDSRFEHLTSNCLYPKLALVPVETLENNSTKNGHLSHLPKIEELSTGPDDVCFIYLTSGSTSGRPKIVPYTQSSTSIYYKSQFGIWLGDKKFGTQDVFNVRGTLCSVAAMIQYLGCLYTGSSIIYTSGVYFSKEEFFSLVNVGGMNRFTTYGTYLAPHLQTAKTDTTMLKLLQGMRTISYGGVPISKADDDWCFQNSVLVMDMYATTECGLLMTSLGPCKPARHIRPVPGLSYIFEPITQSDPDARSQLSDNPSRSRDPPNPSDSSSTQLYEFVLLADSPQIPALHLCSADGNFRSGDLFEQFPDGSYTSRGRNDDWIKTFHADRIDANAIEAKIYELCGDLLRECVVVGHLRLSPALFITIDSSHRIAANIAEADDALKESILERLEGSAASQYVHEQVTDKRLIFIVNQGALPRTNKGNFKRRGVEQKYQSELDAAYKAVYGQ